MTVEAGVMDRIELSELVDISIACEHTFHETDKERHDGDAECIQHNGDCQCESTSTAFVCAKWRAHVSYKAASGQTLYCRECRIAFPAATITYTKI